MKIIIETTDLQETAQILTLLNQLGIQGVVSVVEPADPVYTKSRFRPAAATPTPLMREWSWAGSARSGGKLDNQNIRDWAYE